MPALVGDLATVELYPGNSVYIDGYHIPGVMSVTAKMEVNRLLVVEFAMYAAKLVNHDTHSRVSEVERSRETRWVLVPD